MFPPHILLPVTFLQSNTSHQTHDPRSIPKQTSMTLFKPMKLLCPFQTQVNHYSAIRSCLVCALLHICLSLILFPTKTPNTGLFKGRSLFAFCLLLRQIFQGMRKDIKTCTLEAGGGKVSRCLSNAKCERIPIHCFLL